MTEVMLDNFHLYGITRKSVNHPRRAIFPFQALKKIRRIVIARSNFPFAIKGFRAIAHLPPRMVRQKAGHHHQVVVSVLLESGRALEERRLLSALEELSDLSKDLIKLAELEKTAQLLAAESRRCTSSYIYGLSKTSGLFQPSADILYLTQERRKVSFDLLFRHLV